MASGQARSEYERTGERVRIVDAVGNPRWSDLWDGLPWIKRRDEPIEPGEVTIRNGPKCRPYIRYPFTRDLGCTYTGWAARDHVGAICFQSDELEFAMAMVPDNGAAVLIEPNIPIQSNPNKQWGEDRWRELVKIISRSYTPPPKIIQVGPRGTPTLPGAILIETPTFRHGAAVLAMCRAAVLPEGGLHHAAAVRKVPAVVLFGGAVDVNATGYPMHRNIATPPACGKWRPCDHCAEIWAKITPEFVAAELATVLHGR